MVVVAATVVVDADNNVVFTNLLPTRRTTSSSVDKNDDDEQQQQQQQQGMNSEAATAGDSGGESTTIASLPSVAAAYEFRKASFTEPESFVLNSLLFDNKKKNNDTSSSTAKNTGVVDNDMNEDADAQQHKPASLSFEMLSSVPLVHPHDDGGPTTTTNANAGALLSPKHHHNKNLGFVQRDPPKRVSILGLWSAHAAGVHPRALIQEKKKTTTTTIEQKEDGDEPVERKKKEKSDTNNNKNGSTPAKVRSDGQKKEEQDDEDCYPSDVEVVNGGMIGPGDDDDSLSWDSQDDKNHHSYDAWEVLKDEYSPEYGFGYTASSQNLNDTTTTSTSIESGFAILGTSADDTSARPHVLSPPLIDSLLNFLPEAVSGQNVWLRFSLIRDGASLETLKRYVRAADHTILAVETPDGQVFGAYCSSPWRTQHGYFGSPESAFVWKMRYSRRTKCASLFDQAQLESEIDVYMAAPRDPEQPIQVCRRDLLAVGGYDDRDDEEAAQSDLDDTSSAFLRTRVGFAICIDEFLARGTTSFSATFHNPSLYGKGDNPETFDIANLEVWSLTPCLDVDTAERLELNKYFVEHNSGSSSHRLMSTSPPGSRRNSVRQSSISNAADFTQDAFFRRVGNDSESESRREHWQYLDMMQPELGPNGKHVMGSSPRFTP